MKKLILIVALLIGHLYLHAQQFTFFNHWGDHHSNAGYDTRQLKDSGYIIVGEFTDSTNYPNEGLLLRTDKYGNLLKLKIVCGRTGSIYKTTDSSIFVFGGYLNACGSNGVFLYEVNYNLDTIWSKDFNFSFNSYSDVGVNEHYVIGSSYVTKLDSNWNVEWYKDYNNLGANFNLIKTTPDGGFIAAGLNNIWHTKKTYALLKCDKNGKKQWYRKYGNTPFNGMDDFPPLSIFVLPDSNYIITTTGNWDLFKVNKDSGDTVFTRQYSNNSPTLSTSSILPISNNRYVANTKWGFTLLDSAFNFISYGTPYGVSYWYQANDGGFYGTRWISNIAFPSLNYDAVALIKTDSLGNIYNFQGIEQLQGASGLSVYPNPTTNELAISNGQLANKAVTVRVYDVMGKQKLHQKLTATDGKLKLEVSSLVSGIYFLRVEEKGKVYNGKFIKL